MGLTSFNRARAVQAATLLLSPEETEKAKLEEAEETEKAKLENDEEIAAAEKAKLEEAENNKIIIANLQTELENLKTELEYYKNMPNASDSINPEITENTGNTGEGTEEIEEPEEMLDKSPEQPTDINKITDADKMQGATRGRPKKG